MRTARIIPILLALCLLLCCCAQQTPAQNNAPSSNGGQPVVPDEGGNDSAGSHGGQNDNQDPNTDIGGEVTPPVFPTELTMELTAEWDNVDALLPQLDELSELLRTAVEEAGCPLDRVTITISTAGGFTAESLVNGGIDAAIIPALDIISYENRTSIIALSGEEIPATAIAVSRANEASSEEFNRLLLRALTETESGREFLTICCGAAAFSAPSEEGLQAVREYLAELNKAAGGLTE